MFSQESFTDEDNQASNKDVAFLLGDLRKLFECVVFWFQAFLQK